MGGDELGGRLNAALSRLEDVISGDTGLGEDQAALLSTAHGCASQLERMSKQISEAMRRLEDVAALRKAIDDPAADFSFNIKFRPCASGELRQLYVDKERGAEAISLILDDLTLEAETKLKALVEDIVDGKDDSSE